jgi:hypothetical protein
MPDVQREQRLNPEAGENYEAEMMPWSNKVLIKFDTNPDGQKGSIFRITIGPYEFNDLAQYMMSADLMAAIKAFGLALQGLPEISDTTHPPV